jgi:Uma2 family endonuclease
MVQTPPKSQTSPKSALAQPLPGRIAPENLAPENLAPENLAPDNFAPDNFAPDNLAPDRIQVHRHRTWAQFKHLQLGFEDTAGVHLYFFEETVEILMPGRQHELFKKLIAILLETFCADHHIEFVPTGSMDREQEGRAAAQPDESYEIGESTLAIEVIVTSGTIAKLELYQALGIDEVWFWQDGVLKLFHLSNGLYQKVESSQIPDLATLNISALTDCILLGETSRLKAVETFRAAHGVSMKR